MNHFDLLPAVLFPRNLKDCVTGYPIIVQGKDDPLPTGCQPDCLLCIWIFGRSSPSQPEVPPLQVAWLGLPSLGW